MQCRLCRSIDVSSVLPLCVNCLRERIEETKKFIKEAHKTRCKFSLPAEAPKNKGIRCFGCGNECIIAPGQKGFCGLVVNSDGKLQCLLKSDEAIATWYYDLLPTNCVAAHVCAERRAGPNRYNLSVFYGACNYDCLFCQNWQYREMTQRLGPRITKTELANKINEKTACVCYFGGDPGPQLAHAVAVSEIAVRKGVRVCLESNGNLNKGLLEKFATLSIASKGTIKFDLKFWTENVNLALCGVSNKKTYENFAFLASNFWRDDPPSLHASSLIVPHYFDEIELKKIVDFIASLNPLIPYSLLAFWPTYQMADIGYVSLKKALEFKKIAEKKLENVRLGNLHLLV